MGFKIQLYNPDVIIVPDHCAPLLSINIPKKTKAIWISHHNPERFLDNPLLGNNSKIDVAYAVKLENSALKKVDTVICPSEYMVKVFKNTYKYSQDIGVVHNFININYIDRVGKGNIRKKIGLTKKDCMIYIPSGGSSLKGSRYLFEIIRRLSKSIKSLRVGFYISGYIPVDLKYEFSIFKNIFNPGTIDFKSNISFLKDCDLCISPTLIESFGMAILESVISGIPVIAFDTGGVSEIIENDINGYCVDYLDIESLVQKSINIIETGHYEKLQLTTRDYSRKVFNGKNQFKKLEKVING